MAAGIIVTDKDGRIKSINPAAKHIMGTGSEHVGLNFFEITGQLPFYNYDGVNIPADQRPARAVLRPGVPFFNQVFGFDRMGTDRLWLLSSCRLLNPDMPGQSDLLVSFSDVTAERAVADKTMFFATRDARRADATAQPRFGAALAQESARACGEGPAAVGAVHRPR